MNTTAYHLYCVSKNGNCGSWMRRPNRSVRRIAAAWSTRQWSCLLRFCFANGKLPHVVIDDGNPSRSVNTMQYHSCRQHASLWIPLIVRPAPHNTREKSGPFTSNSLQGTPIQSTKPHFNSSLNSNFLAVYL